MSADMRQLVSDTSAPSRRARQLVLLSAAFLAAQVLFSDYGSDGPGAAVFWFAIGAVLLWFVYRRRSASARLVVIVLSFVGAAIFAAASLTEPSSTVLVLAYLGQAVPLMLAPVRRHVAPPPLGPTPLRSDLAASAGSGDRGMRGRPHDLRGAVQVGLEQDPYRHR